MESFCDAFPKEGPLLVCSIRLTNIDGVGFSSQKFTFLFPKIGVNQQSRWRLWRSKCCCGAPWCHLHDCERLLAGSQNPGIQQNNTRLTGRTPSCLSLLLDTAWLSRCKRFTSCILLIQNMRVTTWTWDLSDVCITRSTLQCKARMSSEFSSRL